MGTTNMPMLTRLVRNATGNFALSHRSSCFHTWLPRDISVEDNKERIANWTTNTALQSFVYEHIRLMQPKFIHLCDGSEDENKMLLNEMVQAGVLVKLDESK